MIVDNLVVYSILLSLKYIERLEELLLGRQPQITLDTRKTPHKGTQDLS